MNRSGPRISGLMTLVVGVAVVLAAGRYVADPESSHPILVFSVLYTIVVIMAIPVQLRRSQWVAIDAENIPIDPEGPGVSAEVARSYREAVAGLAPLGFRPVQSYRKAKLVPGAVSFSTLFEDERTGDVATLINTFVSRGFIRIKTNLLVFRTEFEDGAEVLTTNNNFPTHVPPQGPPIHVYILPQVRDPARLHAVHRALVGRFEFEGASPRLDPIGDDPDAYLKRSERRAFDHFLACGYYDRDEARRVLRLTWKGAIMTTLKQTPPVRAIRNLGRRRVAARLLRDLGMA